MDNNIDVDFIIYMINNEYWYKKDSINDKLTPWNLNKLRFKLKYPFKIGFYDIDKVSIKYITSLFLDNDIDISFNKKFVDDGATGFDVVTFSKERQVINCYFIDDKCLLYGRVNNPNPYLLTEINNFLVLMEVSKDYAKENEGKYYFLENDLTLEEKDSLDVLYRKIIVDNVYCFNYDNKCTDKKDIFRIRSLFRNK